MHELVTPGGNIAICLSCAGALKAVLPDAPDWAEVAHQAALNIAHLAGLFECDVPWNKRKHAQAILEAAQRLMEAAGHLQEET